MIANHIVLHKITMWEGNLSCNHVYIIIEMKKAVSFKIEIFDIVANLLNLLFDFIFIKVSTN